MIVKIGVSFSVREAREIVRDINNIGDGDLMLDEYPALQRLLAKLESPLEPDKIPAVVDNVQAP